MAVTNEQAQRIAALRASWGQNAQQQEPQEQQSALMQRIAAYREKQAQEQQMQPVQEVQPVQAQPNPAAASFSANVGGGKTLPQSGLEILGNTSLAMPTEIQQAAINNAARNNAQRKAAHQQAMQNSAKEADWGKVAQGALYKGADQFVGGLANSLDWVVGTLTKGALGLTQEEYESLNTPTTAFKNWLAKEADKNTKYFADAAGDNKAAQLVDQYGTATIAALPQAAMALMTGGASAAASSGSLAASSASGLGATVNSAIQGMAKNPQYWLSFLTTAGNDYESARADGANDLAATSYALINGLTSAVVEMGGGIEALPGNLKKGGGKAVLEWVKSALDEGKEEVVQGAIQRGLENLVYGKNNPVFSVTDENAIVNPKTMAQEFGGGAVVGGLLGGGQALVQGGLSAVTGRGQVNTQPTTTQADTAALNAQNEQQSANTDNIGQNVLDLVNEAVNGKEKAASEETADKADARLVTEKIKQNIAQLQGDSPVAQLSGNEFPKSEKKLTEQVGDFFKSLGNAVFRKGFGNVILDERGVKSDIAHGLGRAKSITFAAVPDVIANGRQIDYQQNWKGRGYDSYIFAAPVKIGTKDSYVAAVVLKDKTNRFYLHEVVDGDGNIIFIKNGAPETIKTGVTADGGITGSSGTPIYNQNVAQTEPVVNRQNNVDVDVNVNTPQQADIYGKSTGAATLARGPMVETQAKTLTENRFLPNEAKATLDIAKHERVSNAMQFARANGRLMTDSGGNIVYFNEQVDDVLSIERWDGADRDVAMLLAKEAWNRDDKETWRTLTERIVKADTGFAQGLQGTQKWMGTPQHKVDQAIEAVNKQNEAKKNKANKTAVAKKARTIKDTVSKQAEKAAQEALDFLGEKEGIVKRIFNSSAKDLKLQMQKLITQSWENKQAVHDQLVKFVVDKYGFVDADAENAVNLISTEFYDRLATKSAKELDRRFTPRNTKKKSYADRFKELFNLGAFNDEFFTKLATERLYGEDISLSVKEAEQIYSLMDSALKETDPYMRSLYEYKANEIVASKMPKPLAKKIFTALYDSMLGNLRTTVSRNAGGNIGFAAVEQTLRKANTAAVDWATSKVTGERYYAMPSTDYYRAYGKGLKKGAVETVKDFDNKAHTSRSGETKSEFVNETTPFDNRILTEIDRVVGALLEIGDRPFYEAQYAARMQELTALRDANKLSPQQAETFDEWASGYAKLDALEAVFQNDSNMAKAFAGLKDAMSNMVQGATGVAGVGGQAAIPFTKTPGNLIENAIDYMPVIGEAKNAIQTLVEAKKGEFDQARFSKQTGRNLAGLEAAALLYAPIAAGLVTGGGDDREDKEQLEASGWQEYSIKIGDSYYSYDWIPVLGPLMASLADFHEARKYGDASLVEAGMSGLGTAFEQSALQGFNRLFGGFSGNMVEGFADSLLGISSQVTPSLMRQVARATDEYERETYDPNAVKSQLNYVMSGVPGLRETLPVKTDIYGEPMLVSDGRDAVDRLIENLISPAYRSDVNADAVNDELLRLSNTGNAVNIPTVDKSYDINKDGRNEQLTTEQYTTFKETRGQKLHGVMESIINTEGYEELPDNIKADALSKAVELASTAAREELITNAGGEYKHDYEDELELSDSDLGAYLVYKTTFNDAKKSEGSDFIDELLDGFNKQSKAVIDTLMEVAGFKDVASAHDAGISSEKYYDLKDMQKGIDNVNDWAAAIDQGKGAASGLTGKQKEWAKDNFNYGNWIPTPAGESRYTSLAEEYGLSSEMAQNVVHAIDAIEPQEGKDSAQLWQKYDAIAKMDATDQEKLKAIKAYTSTDKAYEKIVLAVANGCTLEQVATYKRLQNAFSKVSEQDAYYDLLGLTQSEYNKLKSYLK